MTRARRFVAAAAAGALLSSGMVWAAAPSFAAACTTVGGFEIDGNMDAGTCAPPGTDWGTPGLGVQSVSPFGTYNTANKDSSDPSVWDSSGSTPCKSQFTAAYSFAQVVGGSYFAYGAIERCDVTGTGGFAIEIDYAPVRVAADGTPRPDRSLGGAVFYLTFQGASAPLLGATCTFTSQATYPTDLTGCNTSTVGYTAAINTTPIDDPISGVTGIPSGAFVEFGLDVTALAGIKPGCPAPATASLYLRSFTGDSAGPGSNLKGYAKPISVAPPSTCVVPPMETTATPGGNLVPRGSAQHDVATLSGEPLPTGTVTFSLCAPAQVTAAGCPTGGTQVGSAVPVIGGTATSSAVTDATTPNDLTDGKYCWRADYTPDTPGATHYLPATHTNATTECFTVVHGTPTVTTQIAVTGNHPGALGLTTLGDTATLGDFVGTVTGETVTFNLYGPYADNVTPTCAIGALAFTTAGTLSAGGVATASHTFAPTSAGTYVWTATYPGDTLNESFTDPCNQAAEKTTVVGAVIDVTKSANPGGPVSAGDTIGFDITVTNAGSVPALGTTVTDHLPAGIGGDLNWSLVPPYTGCSITGAIGLQVLTCNLGTVDGPGSLPVIHVESATTAADCGVVSNQASVATTNGTGGDSDVATVTVNCAALSLIKTADAPLVSAGSNIGFTVTASNSSAAGTGTAHGVVISDPLPTGSGVDWSIDSQTASACAISGIAPSVQTVTCNIGDLAPGFSYSVHVTSHTAYASCTDYKNTATLSATNASSIEKSATTTVQCPSIAIVKTANPAGPVSAGTAIGFDITVSNNGLGTATAVTVSDPLPAGGDLSWSLSPSFAGCSVGGVVGAQTLNCTFASIAAGGSVGPIHLASATAFVDCGTVSNTASAVAGNGSTTPATSTASVIVNCPDLTVTKTANPAGPVSAGTAIGFDITVSNNGLGTATAVTVSDPLPAGSDLSWSLSPAFSGCSVGGVVGSQTLNCTFASIAAGGSVGPIHLASATAFADCGPVSNTASAVAGNGSATPATSTASVIVNCPDLTVTKTANPAGPVSAGTAIGFDITVSNSGPGTATAVTVSDPLPAGSDLSWSLSPAFSGCSVGGVVGSQTLNCTFASIAAGGSVGPIHLASATAFADCGPVSNTASAVAGNGSATPATSTALVIVQCPSLTIIKTANPAGPVSAGSSIGFTIDVGNAGPGTATAATLHDVLPAGSGIIWSIAPVYGGPGTCAITGAVGSQVLDCAFGDLVSGAPASVHITSTTVSLSCATYENTATVDAANAPPLESARASTTVQCPDVSIVKTADAATVDAGATIGFTVTASNADVVGTGTATGVVISDPLPTGSGVDWSIDSQTASACTIAGASPNVETVTCNIGNLAPGASYSVHVTSGTGFASCGTYDNSATLTLTNGPTPAPATASTAVQCSTLTLSKTADSAEVNSGSAIGFTIATTNPGPGTATVAVLIDELPAGGGVDWSIDPAYTGPGSCAITGAVPSQTLVCELGDLAAGATASVHVVSATSAASCIDYPNTATLGADNAPSLTADASTTVICAAIEAQPPIARVVPPQVVPPQVAPLAATGAGPITDEIGWAIGLVVLGGLLLAATRRRRVN
jgi:uncharacterized repeat protein (TIGR01451 family)